MQSGERNLSQARLSELIELALSDKVSFKAIKEEFGLKEIEVKNLMRKNLRSGSYTAWRKRIFRKGKTFDVVAHEHMRRELGDIMWYVAQACLALKVDLVDIINGNKEKLSNRFPQKQFNEKFDANRNKRDV